MKSALARHDEILRFSVESRGGYVVKTTGDGFHAAFAVAHNAIDAAVAGQLTLAQEQWGETGPLRVRMGIHSGPAESRDGDYYGTAVNRAARLMSAAHGGQVVVSLTTEELLRDAGDDVDLVELGEHRLRDLSRPEVIFQLCAPGLRPEFGPLRSLDAFPGNLPLQLSSFVGRERTLATISKELDGGRLVTLTGVGGVGKTRLALQAAAEVVPRFPDGAWFCELASADDPDAMVQVVASTLGVSQRGGMSLAGSIAEYLRTKEPLILLDNCEHLLGTAARLAEDILHTCPKVSVLATSREGLGVDGERVVPLSSLDLPDASSGLAETATTEAVRLFCERAGVARPGFALDGANAGHVVEICRRLDGIPLAIELAAARVSAMSPAEVARHLDERFRLLTGGRRTAVERHQTLRATVDWSYSLLSDTERAVFDRLGVFSGGFESAATEAVARGDGVEEWDIIDALANLVAKSMVTVEETAHGTTRYELLETLRAYARERLDEGGESEGWRRRHAEHYARFAEDAGAGLTGADEYVWRSRFHDELANLRAAVTWALDSDADDDGELAVRIVATLANESLADRVAGVGRWAKLACARADRSTPGRHNAVFAAAAWNAFAAGDFEEAHALACESVRDGIAADCPVPSSSFNALGSVASQRGNYAEALDAISRGHAVLPSPDRDLYARAQLHALATVFESYRGDFTAARLEADESMRLARRIGNPTMQAIAMGVLGMAAWRDDPEVARTALEESIRLTRTGAGDAIFVHSLALLAPLCARAGESADALRALQEAVRRGADTGDVLGMALAVGCAIEVIAILGSTQSAAVLYGMLNHGPLAQLWWNDAQRIDRIRTVERIRAELTDDEFERSAALGAAMSFEEGLDYALADLNRLRAEVEAD